MSGSEAHPVDGMEKDFSWKTLRRSIAKGCYEAARVPRGLSHKRKGLGEKAATGAGKRAGGGGAEPPQVGALRKEKENQKPVGTS